jgi:hypothetical protein
MDGRVLTAIYEQPPRTEYIDSWDDVPGDDGRHPPDLQADPIDSTEALKQLVDLGYIEDLGEDVREAVVLAVCGLRGSGAAQQHDAGDRDAHARTDASILPDSKARSPCLARHRVSSHRSP